MDSHPNLTYLTSHYDVFFLDLWGVIHDGRERYPGVKEALIYLNEQGKKIIFLSNAPRRAIRAQEGLERLDIGSELYHHILTSGEVLFHHLQGDHKLNLGSHYYIIGPERDDGLLEGSPYTRTQKLDDTDFLLVTGFDNDASTLEEYQDILDQAYKKDLPFICANPDHVVVRRDGSRALCAGVMADYYEALGGTVYSFGKPYRPIYQDALRLFPDTHLSRIAAIGDNLDTDILGANQMGIDSYLIAGGILAEELGVTHGHLPNLAKLEALCQKQNVMPKGVLPAFIV